MAPGPGLDATIKSPMRPAQAEHTTAITNLRKNRCGRNRGHEVRSSGTRTSATVADRVSDLWPDLGTRQEPGTKDQAPRTEDCNQDQRPWTRTQGLEIRDREAGTKNQRPGTRDLRTWDHGHGPRTMEQESRTRDHGPRPGPGTRDRRSMSRH